MKLKPLIYFMSALVSFSFMLNCESKKKYAKIDTQGDELDTIVIENDSLEYKIVIIDFGFNAWLATQKPRGFYTQNYMERKNIFYVNEYNIRARNPIRYDEQLYPFQIDYEAGIDYGYEVNYLLYHYFLFFEEKYNQNLR